MPPQQEMPLWARVVKARFPKSFVDPPAWVLVFDADLGDEWTPEEIIETTSWMQSKDQDWKPVECAKDLVIAVWTYRKARRLANEVPREACDYCRQGWLDLYPSLTSADIDACLDVAEADELLLRSYHCEIPCRCPKGEQLMRKCKSYQLFDAETEYRFGAQREQAEKLAWAVRRRVEAKR